MEDASLRSHFFCRCLTALFVWTRQPGGRGSSSNGLENCHQPLMPPSRGVRTHPSCGIWFTKGELVTKKGGGRSLGVKRWSVGGCKLEIGPLEWITDRAK